MGNKWRGGGESKWEKEREKVFYTLVLITLQYPILLSWIMPSLKGSQCSEARTKNEHKQKRVQCSLYSMFTGGDTGCVVFGRVDETVCKDQDWGLTAFLLEIKSVVWKSLLNFNTSSDICDFCRKGWIWSLWM